MRNWLNFFKGSEVSNSRRLPSIEDVKDLKGKRVLLRASLNVPVQDGVVTDLFRIEQGVPLLLSLQAKGAKVILIGHIGREPEESLKPVFDTLTKFIAVKWGGEIKDNASLANDLRDGEILLFENLRRDPRETNNDDSLASELAALGDIYVNDAFSDSHREHSSIVGIPRHLPSYFGPAFIKEYEALSKALSPDSPSLFILGGAKFETKIPLVKNLAKKYDQVFIGGALANDIFKARGLVVGKSLVSDIDLSGDEILNQPNITVPIDVVTDSPAGKHVVLAEAVSAEDKIYDAGPATLEKLAPYVAKASSILWNGPLGNFELGFSESTEALAKLIAESHAHSVVGGGDTIASISRLRIGEKFSFLSTAGGAMLTFLETETLPAIDAVLRR